MKVEGWAITVLTGAVLFLPLHYSDMIADARGDLNILCEQVITDWLEDSGYYAAHEERDQIKAKQLIQEFYANPPTEPYRVVLARRLCN